MGEDEEAEVFEDDGEADEDYIILAASGPKKHSGWMYVSLLVGLLKNIATDISQFFGGIETVLDQRTLWEEERQEFSDSVKSDFLTMKIVDAIEEKHAATDDSSGS